MGFYRGGSGRIENLTITGRYGVYVYRTALTTKGCTFSNNYYGIYAYQAANLVDSSTFSSRIYGILSYYGRTSVQSCNFQKGNYGLYSVNEASVAVNNSRFTENTGWPLLLLGNKWRVDNTTVNNNYYGVYMANVTNRDLNFRNCRIENNRYYGVYFTNSRITLDKALQKRLPTKNNGYGYAFSNCTTTIKDVQITAHKYYGVLSWNGSIDIINSTISKNGNGVYLYGNKRSTLTNSIVEGNRSWGMLVYRQSFNLDKTQVRNNGYGMLLYQLTNSQIGLRNSSVTKNKYYGMYLYYCSLNLSPNQKGWGIKDNGNGIYAYRSTGV